MFESVFDYVKTGGKLESQKIFEPAHDSVRTVPVFLRPEDQHDAFALTKVPFVGVYLTVLPKARVFMNASVITEDNTFLRGESFEFLAKESGDNTLYHHFWLPRVEELKGTVALIASEDIQNYHHWMFHTFPRLWQVLSANKVEEIDWFYVNKFSTKFHWETMDRVGIPREKIVFCEDKPHIRADHLLVPSLEYPNLCSSFTCQGLRSTFLPSERSESKRRIYLGRGVVRNRSMTNEAEVLSALTSLGFESHTLDNMTIAQQAELMSTAEIVVAPHGAALTNIVFCDPQTPVLELGHPHKSPLYFWDLACRANLTYSFLPSKAIPPTDPRLAKKLTPDQYDFSVDVPDLVARVQQLIS